MMPRNGLATCAGPRPTGICSGTGSGAEPVADLVDERVEVGAFAVELVDEREPRHVVLVGLPPDGFALGLDPFAGAEDDHGAVEHAQAALDLGGEVDVARRVDQVDRARPSRGT